MAVSSCFSAFLLALTSPVRAQLRALLFTSKTLIEIELSKLSALVGRNDVVAQTYRNVMNQIEAVTDPMEEALAAVPWARFSGCPELENVLSNLENTYFTKKHEYEDLAFKNAQSVFLATNTEKLREDLQLRLDKFTEIIEFIDLLIISALSPGTRVRVYSTGQLGTISSIDGSLVTVSLDVGGSTQVGAGDVGEVNA